jgi:hypothetical protein
MDLNRIVWGLMLLPWHAEHAEEERPDTSCDVQRMLLVGLPLVSDTRRIEEKDEKKKERHGESQ